MKCPQCGISMDRTMGEKDICPACGYDTSSPPESRKSGWFSGQQTNPTVVGVRPPGSEQSAIGAPHGIEVLLKKAAVDVQFCQLLLDKRGDAAGTIGLELTPTEVTMLNSIPKEQLEATISNTVVPETQRRIFSKNNTSAMLAAIAETCSCPTCLQLKWEAVPTRGIRPDGQTKGIRPDFPDDELDKDRLKNKERRETKE